MKELIVTRTVRCPKEQIVEKEIYGDTIKHRKKNWPLSIDSCKKCDYHSRIIQYRDGKPPKVRCRYDEAPLRADIKKPIEWIKHQCLEKKKPTGFIQDHLMDLGMTLEEADVLVNHWYKDLPEDWFEYDKCGCEPR